MVVADCGEYMRRLEKDLGMKGFGTLDTRLSQQAYMLRILSDYNVAISVFFIIYAAVEIPSNLICKVRPFLIPHPRSYPKHPHTDRRTLSMDPIPHRQLRTRIYAHRVRD